MAENKHRFNDPVQMINATKAERLANQYGIVTETGVCEFKAGWTCAMRKESPHRESPTFYLGYRAYQNCGG